MQCAVENALPWQAGAGLLVGLQAGADVPAGLLYAKLTSLARCVIILFPPPHPSDTPVSPERRALSGPLSLVFSETTQLQNDVTGRQ